MTEWIFGLTIANAVVVTLVLIFQLVTARFLNNFQEDTQKRVEDGRKAAHEAKNAANFLKKELLIRMPPRPYGVPETPEEPEETVDI